MILTERCTIFISDLHIDAEKPEITQQFLEFMQGLYSSVKHLDALYILGDWFESWVGDDDPDQSKWEAIKAVKKLADLDVPCYFMAGNRDFLVGNEFASASGCEILDDPSIIGLYGSKVLLMHGDTLCTDDVEYQKFRALSRSPEWQSQIKAMPLEQRVQLAGEIRMQSQIDTGNKDNNIMDVNHDSVSQAFREHQVTTLIHGHTHRPAIHQVAKSNNLDTDTENTLTRIVLGDWYSQGSVLIWRKKNYELITLAR